MRIHRHVVTMIHWWLALIGSSCLASSKLVLWQSDTACSFKEKLLKFTPTFMNAIWDDRYFGRYFSVCGNYIFCTNHSCIFLHELNADVFGNLTLLSTKFDSVFEVSDIKVSDFVSISGVTDLIISQFFLHFWSCNSGVTTFKFDSISEVS